jgi:hypothetical protein
MRRRKDRRPTRGLKIHATPGFEHLAGQTLTLNGKIATPEVLKQAAGESCGICGSTDVRSYVSLLVMRRDLLRALDTGDADGKIYPICITCESLGQDVFLLAMERRLRADMVIEGGAA